MDNFNLETLESAIAELPEQAATAVLDKVGGTPLGMALSEGNKLRDYMAQLSPQDMAIIAERLIEAGNALGDDLMHRPHFDSVMDIINATAHAADDENQFYTQLRTLVPAIPGVNSEGEPLAHHHLYERSPDADYSVTNQAREALRSPMLDDTERDYWWEQVFKVHPDLRGRADITANDIPYDQSEVDANLSSEAYNSALGEAAGKVLQSLGHSNRSGMPEEATTLTLEDAQEFVEAQERNHSIIRTEEWAENNPEPAQSETVTGGA